MSDHGKYTDPNHSGVTYPIAEQFYSLQGEGYWAGTPATFIRLAGCSVGCSWCDTDYRKKDERRVEDLVSFAVRTGARHVVLTGGEPTDHDLVPLLERCRKAGLFVQIETAGLKSIDHLRPHGLNWITVSPKATADKLGQRNGEELKAVFAWPREWYPAFLELVFSHWFMQPLETHGKTNAAEVVEYVKANPKWRMSVQTHKALGIR